MWSLIGEFSGGEAIRESKNIVAYILEVFYNESYKLEFIGV